MTEGTAKVSNQQHADPSPQQAALLRKLHEATLQMAQVAEFNPLVMTIVEHVEDLVDYGKTLLLVIDEENLGLRPANPAIADDQDVRDRLEKAYISIYNAEDDPILSQWSSGEAFLLMTPEDAPDSPVTQLMELVGFQRFLSVPMVVKEHLEGAIILELPEDQVPSLVEQEVLQMFARSSAALLDNTRSHTQAVEQLAENMKEMSIIHQIDRELNETIALPTVFTMALDWALRFTNANTASIALYDEESDTLRTMVNYGFEISDKELEALRSQHDNTITHRVARSGRLEVTPDIMMDKDYAWTMGGIQSQMAIPVMREDRVVGVITLESRKLNAFTDDHIDFVQKLANRAAVAIDNARLYDETVREREKLSHILGNIANPVLVIGSDDRIVTISQSAISALQLYIDMDYRDKLFTEVIPFSPLINVYKHAKEQDDAFEDELTLPNERVYYTKVMPQQGVGWIVVMQDITPFKETDRLKSELIATVSHDLKQPLGVMRGYLDLLQMKNTFDETSSNFIGMIDRAINNMRQLIDDLLDLARIESGMDFEFKPISLKTLLRECIDNQRASAQNKAMNITSELPDDLPNIEGEYSRLQQIFGNLISNAIKYTPPEGHIKVAVENRGATVRVSVEDNGLGISPEDQAHVFDRFYRVRRPETESIDGTGLGLAIVKSLVEAHHGKIRLESRLGQGTTFFVTLPVKNGKPQ